MSLKTHFMHRKQTVTHISNIYFGYKKKDKIRRGISKLRTFCRAANQGGVLDALLNSNLELATLDDRESFGVKMGG